MIVNQPEQKEQAVARFQAAVREQQERYETLVAEFQAFRQRVRTEAIYVQKEHSSHISVSALNVWLEDLDLEPVSTKVIVTLTVQVTFGQAISGDDAIQVNVEREYELEDDATDSLVEYTVDMDHNLLEDYDFGNEWEITNVSIEGWKMESDA